MNLPAIALGEQLRTLHCYQGSELQHCCILKSRRARAAAARSIVEYGTSFGLPTIFLAAALRDNGGGRLISTELEPDKAARAQRNLERADLADLVEIRVGGALDSLRAGALILADNIDMVALVEPYTAYVREPQNGYLSSRVVLGEGLEVSVRLG